MSLSVSLVSKMTCRWAPDVVTFQHALRSQVDVVACRAATPELFRTMGSRTASSFECETLVMMGWLPVFFGT